MSTNTPLPGPGWHPDPHQHGFLRYWDGSSWTAHVSPIPPAPLTPPPAAGSTRRTRWWIGAAVAVLDIGGIGALSDDSADQAAASVEEPTPTAPTVSESSDDPEPSPTAEPTPTRADVPDVTGLPQAAAGKALDEAGLSLGQVKRVYSSRPAGTVLGQTFGAGDSVLLGAAVGLVVAKAIPSIPGTAGRLKGAAISALEAAGYRVVVSNETRTSGTEGTVLRQSPVGGTRMKPGGTVRIVVAHIVRPVVAAPQPSSCTPGYEPCLTPASDYDCAGGSGDGPAYADGPIYVTGSDPYDLDSEGDGIACE